MVQFFSQILSILLISTFCAAQRNEAELFAQHQEAFCQLWKHSRIEQQQALADLCFRRVRRFGDQVQIFLLIITLSLTILASLAPAFW
jgi:hypothetical protein